MDKLKVRRLVAIGICMCAAKAAIAASPRVLDCRPMFANPVIVHGTTGRDYITYKDHNKVEVRRNNQNGQLIATYTKKPNQGFLINASQGNDTVVYQDWQSPKVQICTGAGNDIVKLELWSGNRGWVFLGSGNDTYQGKKKLFGPGGSTTNGGLVHVDAGAGNDVVTGRSFTPVDQDSFNGGSGRDCLISTGWYDELNGGTGNDYLLSGYEGYLHGSGGTDTCFLHGDETLSSCENVVGVSGPWGWSCESLGYTR